MQYIRQYIRQQIVIVIKNRSLCTRKKHRSSHSLLTDVKGLDSDCSLCALIGQTLGPSPSAFPATRAMLNQSPTPTAAVGRISQTRNLG